MKHLKLLFLTFLFMSLGSLQAQQLKNSSNLVTQEISIAYSKTTTIVFPFPIASVDRGSQDLLVQKAKGLENVLQVKAALHDFSETNLTVITNDGKLYSFRVCYDEDPITLAISLPDTKSGNLIQFDAMRSNAKKMESAAEMAFYERKKVNGIREENYGITLSLTGLYIYDDLLYYKVKIENETPISYDIDQLRFFVKDQKRSKRTASQEVEIIPVVIHRQVSSVQAQSNAQFVCILPKFTIPDKKNLMIHLVERSGGRHIQLELKNKKTAKVVPLGY